MLTFAVTSPLWFATRGAGIVALLLLSVALVLGIAGVKRLETPRWPRFVIDAIHRSASLLAVVFVAVHVATTVLDGYVPIGWLDALVPFASGYRTLWVGLGTIAFDVLLALGISGILRRRIGQRAWRAIHWSAYACWPLAMVHALGSGSDAWSAWFLAVAALCGLAVAGAVALRLSGPASDAASSSGARAGRGASAGAAHGASAAQRPGAKAAIR